MSFKSLASVFMAAIITIPSISLADKKRDFKPAVTSQDLKNQLESKEAATGNKALCTSYINQRQQVLTQINDLASLEKKLNSSSSHSELLQNIRIWSAVAAGVGVGLTILASKNSGNYGEGALGTLFMFALTGITGVTSAVSAGLEALSDGQVAELKLDLLQASQEAKTVVQQLENLCK